MSRCFQTLDNKHHKAGIPKRKETNEIIPVITLAFKTQEWEAFQL